MSILGCHWQLCLHQFRLRQFSIFSLNAIENINVRPYEIKYACVNQYGLRSTIITMYTKCDTRVLCKLMVIVRDLQLQICSF